jgi:hypothetical protein
MAEILDRDDVAAVPQQDDARCIYASDGQALVSVSVRTREQFDAERTASKAAVSSSPS